MTTTPEFRTWAVVELFGHVTLAGEVSEQTLGGSAFIRLDVPEVNGQAAFTKLYGPGAIYSITPVSEEVARRAVENLRPKPISVYLLPSPKQPNEDPEIDDKDRDNDDFDADY